MTNTRNNDTWLKDLRSQGEEHEAALADLRTLLLEDLRRGLSKWLPSDHSDFEFLMDYTAEVTLARVLSKLDTYKGRSQFISWVYKIAVRIALNEWRRLRWRDISLGTAENETSNDRRSRLLAAASPDGLHQNIQSILVEELSARERMLLFAIYFQGMPIKEVARRLETNRSTLYELLHSIRLRILQRLISEKPASKELLKAMEKGNSSDLPPTYHTMHRRSTFDWLRRRTKRRLQPDAPMQRLLCDLAKTEEHEVFCEDVYEVVDQVVEAERRGHNDLSFMPHVRQHLALCLDCREEYDALGTLLAPRPE
jgi:RNA polymerase sigma-70 factor (ECF subfamily)